MSITAAREHSKKLHDPGLMRLGNPLSDPSAAINTLDCAEVSMGQIQCLRCDRENAAHGTSLVEWSWGSLIQ